MRLGSVVPNFKADTTMGPIGFYDWQRTSWVVLFSHPENFTPVCISEMARLAVSGPEFHKRNTKCLIHSVDTLSSHMKWIADVRYYNSSSSIEFPFPIIADQSRDLAVQFGMLDEEEKNNFKVRINVRAWFLIDPSHKLRLAMHYPVSCGRSLEEIYRTIDSLQLTDRLSAIATPVNWISGEEIMILDSMSDTEANTKFPGGFLTLNLPSRKKYIRTTKDYAKPWVVMFSYPQNFTPVCLTEMSYLAINNVEFQKRDTKCLAYSIDQTSTHTDWIQDVKFYSAEMTSEFPYPIISDPKRELAILFGMLSEDQIDNPEYEFQTRATFLIDPSHKLRFAMYYPTPCGRNINEILRTIDSLQLTQRLSVVATPINWKPGTKIMILDAVTETDARKYFPYGFRTLHMPSGRKYITTNADYPNP